MLLKKVRSFFSGLLSVRIIVLLFFGSCKSVVDGRLSNGTRVFSVHCPGVRCSCFLERCRFGGSRSIFFWMERMT